MNTIQTIFAVALPAEARPINHHFGLQRDNRYNEFPLYRRDRLALVITGCGGDAASKAAIWIASRNNSEQRPAWINIGIAGHPSMKIGRAVLAKSIENAASGQIWHPALPDNPPCTMERIITLKEPDLNYSHNAAVEMEAAALLQLGSAIIDPKQFYCLKIISDNRQHPSSEINGKIVSNLITGQLELITLLLQQIETER